MLIEITQRETPFLKKYKKNIAKSEKRVFKGVL